MTLQTTRVGPESAPPNMNVFAPHGAVHAQAPCNPGPHLHCCPYNQPYSPPPCPGCAPNEHPPCRYRCPANDPRAPEQTYTVPPACPCRQAGAPLTVNVNGPVLTPLMTCGGGGPHVARPHAQAPNRLFLNPEATGRPVCVGGWGGIPAHACGQRAPNRFVRGF